MRRIILVASGVLLAFVGGSFALVVGMLAEAFSLPVGTSLDLTRLAAVFLVALQAGTAGTVLGAGLSALWTALVAACFVPVCLIATLGEAAQLRSFAWAAGGTGLVTAVMPSVLRSLTTLSARGPLTGRESRLTVLLFLVGLVAGTIYWLVAGVRTGGSR